MQKITLQKKSFCETVDNLRSDCEYELTLISKVSVKRILWFTMSNNPDVIYYTEPIRKILRGGDQDICYSAGAKYTIIYGN